MTADGLADLSASARAEFSGVMVIDTVATAAGKPKTLYITGAFYTGEAVMGVFKYFNKYDYTFEPESRWMVHTTVRSYHTLSSAAEQGCRLLYSMQRVFPRRESQLTLKTSLMSWVTFSM